MVSGQVLNKKISPEMIKKRISISLSRMLNAMISSLLIILFAVSCVNKRDKVEHEDLIPEDKFVSILSDMYLVTGLLSIPEILYEFGGRDSIMNYIDIIESYGFSYEKMNSTMNYYFVSKPKKLIRIYDNIIKNMSEMETHYQNEIMKADDLKARSRIYYSEYFLPVYGEQKKPALSKILGPPGTFTLEFTITLYPDDQSYCPSFQSLIVDADSIDSGKKKDLQRINYIKDGYPHRITISRRLEGSRPVILEMDFYNHSSNTREGDKHASIEINSFSYIPDVI